MLTALPTLDALLAAHAGSLGEDATGYRHHAYRVANFYWLLAPGDADALEKLSIAVAFHDLGIWTAGTFDYLPPSRVLARDYLHQTGKAAWMVDVDAMIECHHKVMRTPAGTSPVTTTTSASMSQPQAGSPSGIGSRGARNASLPP